MLLLTAQVLGCACAVSIAAVVTLFVMLALTLLEEPRMPLIQSASNDALQANIKTEYESLLAAEKRKPKAKRRSKQDISKQAYAIAKGVQVSNARSARESAADFIVMEGADAPPEVVIDILAALPDEVTASEDEWFDALSEEQKAEFEDPMESGRITDPVSGDIFDPETGITFPNSPRVQILSPAVIDAAMAVVDAARAAGGPRGDNT